ncbi:hypothetical protein [Amycolatopsis thermoflava]|uniref:hypothetical protein n=1 Tax=Amycolatopsis thermoflava TaxID=84480 RepID=UPI0038069366
MPMALGVLALVAGACAGKPDDSAGDADISAVLGTADKATGTPLLLGMISEGKATTVDTTPEIDGARAAVGYLNEHLEYLVYRAALSRHGIDAPRGPRPAADTR